MIEECDYCIKHKTIYCPNSSECYSLNNLPHFKTNFDILRENNILNKGIDELITEYENASKNFVTKILVDKIITDLKKLKGE